MEGAYEVLAPLGVDTGLSSNRAVDHREQRRRQLHVRDASQIGRREEPGQVADHAAAQRQDGRVAAETPRKQLVGQVGPGRSRLRRFSWWQDERLGGTDGCGGAPHRRFVQWRHRLVGDDGIATGRAVLVQQ